MITYFYGNILNADTDIICHQVNCCGKMAAGLALQIKQKYNNIFEEYRHFYEAAAEPKAAMLLGKTQLVKCDYKYIANMFAQVLWGSDGERYTNYEAFYNCLIDLKRQMDINHLTTAAFPYQIGCGLGGAKWKIIEAMIDVTSENYDFQIWRLK
jgi:O-acetyl-ADP-ribose deacetylase (regulator of RNase III)